MARGRRAGAQGELQGLLHLQGVQVRLHPRWPVQSRCGPPAGVRDDGRNVGARRCAYQERAHRPPGRAPHGAHHSHRCTRRGAGKSLIDNSRNDNWAAGAVLQRAGVRRSHAVQRVHDAEAGPPPRLLPARDSEARGHLWGAFSTVSQSFSPGASHRVGSFPSSSRGHGRRLFQWHASVAAGRERDTDRAAVAVLRRSRSRSPAGCGKTAAAGTRAA
mmetsp:Transcript_16748/g.39452  ORF Transcript_16748/g.39452 Transcript_16748/m.39452 type:complete len:217 (-) Transcript_16748:1604-2254(-)